MTGQLVLRKAAWGKDPSVWTLRASVTHPNGMRSQLAKTFKGSRRAAEKAVSEFEAPADVAKVCNDKVTDLVKRVIGVPGDSLMSKGNTIYVNGKALKENWLPTEPLGGVIKPIILKKGQYFMMGDNHFYSCDSRPWGAVPRSSIIGKVFLRVWPVSRFHWI